MRLQAASLAIIAGTTGMALALQCGIAYADPAKPAAAAKPGAGAAKPADGKSGIDVDKPYGYHLQPILEQISATSDQKVKISQVVGSYKGTIQPLRERYKEKQQEFIDSMISGASAETIMARQVELGHLSSEITSKYCLMRLEIRRYLSPQQILQFEKYGREHGWNH